MKANIRNIMTIPKNAKAFIKSSDGESFNRLVNISDSLYTGELKVLTVVPAKSLIKQFFIIRQIEAWKTESSVKSMLISFGFENFQHFRMQISQARIYIRKSIF
ncbi:MAG: hypothetical protein LBU32_29870 [Clostridiales bacterium]|nr:hypothetical protein [Clostridiales bacterium]